MGDFETTLFLARLHFQTTEIARVHHGVYRRFIQTELWLSFQVHIWDAYYADPATSTTTSM
jgi:hypothetical protein